MGENVVHIVLKALKQDFENATVVLVTIGSDHRSSVVTIRLANLL